MRTSCCRKEAGRTKPPAVMMSYGAKPGMASVLIPDHTHWGNEGGLLPRLSDGRGISGWDAQYQYLKVPLTRGHSLSTIHQLSGVPTSARRAERDAPALSLTRTASHRAVLCNFPAALHVLWCTELAHSMSVGRHAHLRMITLDVVFACKAHVIQPTR